MKKIYLTILAVAACFAVSCSNDLKETSPVKGEGALTLDVQLPMTKALSADDLLNTASVKIYMADFSGLVRQYTYADAPSTIYLPADSYRVDVEAGEAVKETPAVASWDQKSYKGSSEFSIVAGQNSSVQVVANVNNAVSKVSFGPSIAENFNAGYTLTIGVDPVDTEKQLVYDLSKSGNEGYFLIKGLDEPYLVWTFNGTLTKNGEAFTKSGLIENVEAGKSYSMTLKYTIKDGDVNFDLLVDYSTDVVEDIIVFEPVSTGLSNSSIYEIWAGHATIHADVDETEFTDPSAVKFAYSSNGTDWTTVDATRTGEGLYEATLTGLTGSTTYEYKLVIAGEAQGDSKTFTTEISPNVPNASFEYVSLVSGSSYYKWYDPSCGVEEGQTMFWGSGNGEGSEGVKGSGAMGMIITVVDNDSKVDGERSVCAQSGSIVGMLAAGNIFTGQFNGLIGTSGGKVAFGRPWTSRPTAISVWVKYTTGKVDVIKSLPAGVTLTTSDYDRAEIKCAIGNWNYKTYGGNKENPVLVNTTDESTFVDYRTDASTIAFGHAVVYGDGGCSINDGAKDSVSNSDWRQIIIPLDYHTLTEYPTHIIISAASSQYGDYFTGSSSAKLWLDKVELIYE